MAISAAAAIIGSALIGGVASNAAASKQAKAVREQARQQAEQARQAAQAAAIAAKAEAQKDATAAAIAAEAERGQAEVGKAEVDIAGTPETAGQRRRVRASFTGGQGGIGGSTGSIRI